MSSALCLIISLATVFVAIPASAQTSAPQGTVAGVVRDVATKAPVAGATVEIGDQRVTTDADGRFTIASPLGQVDIRVVAPGGIPHDLVVQVLTSDVTTVEFEVVSQAFTETVDVVAPAPAAAPATQEVAPVQVLRTPGALDNVFRTLQTLPGVNATEEFGSRLAVRGGSPDQNLTVMDNVEIHDPYRLYGLTSAFNPEIIRNFALNIGGFSAKYGDRLSSMLLVENRDGTRAERLAGSAALSITDANVVLEGALPGGAAGSWLVTGRRTYYDLVAERLTDNQFPGFADLQTRVVWEPAAGRTLTLFGLSSRQSADLEIDEDDAQGAFGDDTENDLLWLRYDQALGARGQSHTVAAYSETRSRFGVDAAFENTSLRSNAPDPESYGTSDFAFERGLTVRDLSLRQDLAWQFGAHVVETGGELHALTTAFTLEIDGDRNPQAANGSSQQGGAGLPDSLLSSRSTTRAGVWLVDSWQMRPAVSLQGGLRLDHSGLGSELQVSPRLMLTTQVAGRTRLRAAVGRYTQSPGYEKNVQSDYVLDLTSPEAGRLRSEEAWQLSAGLERTLGAGVEVRLDGYVKRFRDALIGRLETEAERQARIARYDFPADLAWSIPTEALITTVPTNDGRGRAYGFDVMVTRTAPGPDARVRGWASYTWGRAERDAYGRRYAFEYDRRHAFATVASLRLSRRWELATTVRVASGFPRTAPLGVRVAGVDDSVDRDGDGVTDEIVPDVDANGLPIYSVNFGGVDNLNGARLPLFARVDLRATWRPGGPTSRWELYAEVINLFNRQNAGALDPRLEYNPDGDQPRIVEERDQAIPLLPTLGLRFRF
jgi:hypothetical protein